MVHEKLDIEEWIARFPLDQYQDGEIICSPSDLARTEQIRRQVLPERPAEAVPTDIFVFGKGEPSRREATKFGGLPYWPASQEWPRSAEGSPLSFIGQLCFADSRDIVGTAPGDVLLAFGPRGSEYFDPDESEVQFFWRNISDDDLIGPEAMPQVEFPLAPLYGVIHRTYDYPGLWKLFRRHYDGALLAVLEGTKIGGVPRWIQRARHPRGTFLGAFGSLVFRTGVPYPFVNQAEPDTSVDPPGPMWGDMGSVYLFLQGDRDLLAIAQCY